MNKMKMVVKKLVLLVVTALPLMSLADNVTPAWDERVMVPVFHLPGWLLCGSVFAGFVVVSALMFVAMRRKGRSSMDFVVVETMIAAVLTGLLVFCKGTFLCKYEERVIHHPAERPHRCQYCHCSDCYGQCQKRAEARAHAAAQKFSKESVHGDDVWGK